MNDHLPAVSVIIPCYNHGAFIKEAIDSVFASVFKNFEIIIVNDGSTDDLTLRVFKELEKDFSGSPKVTIIHQSNSGLPAARNIGIEQARGEYILPLDSDNRVRPHFLGSACQILDNNPEIGVVYGHAQLFGEKSGIWEFAQFDARRILLGNLVEACSVYRKKIWQDCNGYDPEMKIGYEDWDLWIRAMKLGWRFHLIDEVMFDYRVRKNSMVTGCNLPENRRSLIRYVYRKHEDLYKDNLEYVISETNLSLLHLEKMLEEQQEYIHKIETELKDREATLERIQNSRGWKLISTVYKIRDRLFPLNTARRRGTDKLLSSIDRLRNRLT